MEHHVSFYVHKALLLMVWWVRYIPMAFFILRLILCNIEDTSVFTSCLDHQVQLVCVNWQPIDHMSAAHCIIQLKIFSISDVSRPFPLGSLVSPPWLLLMEYRHSDEENTNSIILLVVPSDQGASVFSWREGEGALFLCCESIKDTKTCSCQLFWRVWNEVRRKSAQIWPLPFEPYWTTAFTGVWTSSCLLNTKHIWFSLHSFVLDMLWGAWWTLCWPGSFWWAFCSFQPSPVVAVRKRSHSF